eukprot:TRINITY_DN17318_c0_g1_i1.p1 TRINITY_DN17318_c0_g1~~TRINITY_DN17318_c0_g1_i1.p1  ORF type:complete len:216 (-),score=47.93 TRINITY_DN17318_c0_g1_i1:44-691(-)
MDNFMANHAAHQQRLNKERKHRRRTTTAYYGAKGCEEIMAPKVKPQLTVEEASKVMFDKLYGNHSRPASQASSASHRSLQPIQRQGSRPKLGGSCGRLPSAGGRNTSSSRGGRPVDGADIKQTSELLFFNNQTRERAPATPSVHSYRSGLTGISGLTGQSATSSILWEQVERAVQEEVAKAVKPLQQQLESEAAARQRAEDALKRVGVNSDEMQH